MTANEWQIVWFTAWVSALSTLVILPPGLAVAWLLARRDWPGKSLVETLVTLPLVLPPVATGLILLKVLGTARSSAAFSMTACIWTSFLRGGLSWRRWV